MANIKYTDVQIEFLESNLMKYSLVELTELYNSTFETFKSPVAIKNTLNRNKIKKPKPAEISQSDLEVFFAANINCTVDELTRRYNKKFASNLCSASVRIRRNKFIAKIENEEEEQTLAFTPYDESLNPHILELASSSWGLLLSKPSIRQKAA